LITSAKKTTGCSAGTCCKAVKQNSIETKVNDENKREAVSLSLFFLISETSPSLLKNKQ
jgi:hypothetical protein